MFLSKAQLVTLTGRTRPDAQNRWLSERGFVFEIDGNGRPIVMTDHARLKMGAMPKTDHAGYPEPDFSYFDDA